MLRYFFMVALGSLLSCASEPPPELPQKRQLGADYRSSPIAPKPKGPTTPIAPLKKLSFRVDILPMLSSNVEGRKYKCTTCHPAYTNSETLKIPGKISAIIQAVSPAGQMPPNGDNWTQEDIKKLTDWQAQGFAE